MKPLGPAVLELDLDAEATRICDWLRDCLATRLHRRGLVVAISGGIDSSVCAALAVRAVGPSRVCLLILPEHDSDPGSAVRAKLLAHHLGVEPIETGIAPALEALGCYRERDAAVRRLVPEYGSGWKMKIAIAGGLEGGINRFQLVVQSPAGETRTLPLPLREYLTIVAATSFKQRTRKTLEYFHADRLNYAVTGTPNRLEFELGFFVKNGDGSADLKPIAHLYKTQVYALARHLGLPERVCAAVPTTDTYSLEQGQDEFYFALPWPAMDLALWAHSAGRPAADLAAALDMSSERAAAVYADIEAKRRATRYLHLPPLRLEAGVP